MTSSPQMPPPGWYPDPAGTPQERYWEGTRWTKNLRDRPDQPEGRVASRQRADEPALPESVATPPHAPTPGWYPPAGPGVSGQGWTWQPAMPLDRTRRTRDGVRLADWGQRAVAALIDTVLTAAVGTLVGWSYALRAWRGMGRLWEWSQANPGVFMPPNPEQFDYATPMSVLLVIISVVSAAHRFLLVPLAGGTVGQLAMGLRVVPIGHGLQPRLSWGQSALRAGAWLLVRLASLVVIFPEVVSYIRPAWHPGSLTYHDSIARTQVIQARHPETRQMLEQAARRSSIR